MKKKTIVGILLCGAMLLAGCSKTKAPEQITILSDAQMMPAIGATYDLSEIVEFTGEEVDTSVSYSSDDTTVVEVSEDGILTAVGFGTATISVVSNVDSSVSDSIDIAVYEYCGTYSGEKFIEAMSCDIAVSIELKADGTYSFYRAPMDLSAMGGGVMSEMTDEGSYVLEGTEILFTGEDLGEFFAEISLGETAKISGKIPTGGPSTEMELMLQDIK